MTLKLLSIALMGWALMTNTVRPNATPTTMGHHGGVPINQPIVEIFTKYQKTKRY
ncbi:MAG: hypothetical protein HKM24_04245 [Gammaproteobacteria bacterium]|nr:hypothetical protein [Gammaproteobacteria bacterium]